MTDAKQGESPSGDSSPTLAKKGSLTPHWKEFKCEPESEIKGRFILEKKIRLHRQRRGLLSKPKNKIPNV